MSWVHTEDKLMESVRKTLEWRHQNQIYNWQAKDLLALEMPFIQISGRDSDGDRVLWINLKYNNSKINDSAILAVAYHFEVRFRFHSKV